MMDQLNEKKSELYAFLFITIFLFPFLAVALIGGFGFAVWISQMLAGGG